MSNKIKSLFSYSHRGEEDNMKDIGIHARIPLKFKDKLSSNELFILAFIEIHHFMDKKAYTYKEKRTPMPIKMFTAVLNMSERTVRYSLQGLKDKKVIKEIDSFNNKEKSYISNVMKFGVKYQMLTLKFLLQPVFTKLTKAFLIKLLMTNNSNIHNIGNVAKLCNDVDMSRNSVKKVLAELSDLNMLVEVEPGIFGINLKYMSEHFDIANYSEMIDIKVELFDKDTEIQKLRDEIVSLKKEILYLKSSNMNMKASYDTLKSELKFKM